MSTPGRNSISIFVSKYDNDESKKDRRKYKALFGHLLPTVDHVGDGLGEPDFKICGWRTNDAKADLTHRNYCSFARVSLLTLNGQSYHRRGRCPLRALETPSARLPWRVYRRYNATEGW
jgi:hypothetical protein